MHPTIKLLILVFLFTFKPVFSAARFTDCTWTHLSQMLGVHIGKFHFGSNRYLLGSGIYGGSVFRRVNPDQSTTIEKEYMENFKSTPDADHQRLELLRSLDNGVFNVVRTQVLSERKLTILDDVQGNSVLKIFEYFQKTNPNFAKIIKQEWEEILTIFHQTLLALEKEGVIVLGNNYMSYSQNDLLNRELLMLRANILKDGKEHTIFIHADNVVVDWNSREFWIIDPF